MKEQLLLLLQLQTIDARVKELRADITNLPKKLEPARSDLAKLEEMLQAEQERLTEAEAWRREQEGLIQLEDEAIRKAKAKLQSAKNSKDYTAASRELDNKRKSKSEREEEVLKVMEALEKSRTEMAAHEGDVSALRDQISAEEAKLAVQVEELRTEAEERAGGRDELVGQLEDKFLRHYNAIMKKRNYAVAAVVDGVCRGCHMAIPPQLNNILARFNSIETCPRCHRMLYRQELLDDAGEKEG